MGSVSGPEICAKCKDRKVERKEAIIELVQTEINYRNDLQILKEVRRTACFIRNWFCSARASHLFRGGGCISHLDLVNKTFWSEISMKLFWPDFACVCQCMSPCARVCVYLRAVACWE